MPHEVEQIFMFVVAYWNKKFSLWIAVVPEVPLVAKPLTIAELVTLFAISRVEM